MKKVELLRDANGEKLQKVRGGRMVKSTNASVRGVWDPFHPPESIGQDLLGDMVARSARGLAGGKRRRKG